MLKRKFYQSIIFKINVIIIAFMVIILFAMMLLEFMKWGQFYEQTLQDHKHLYAQHFQERLASFFLKVETTALVSGQSKSRQELLKILTNALPPQDISWGLALMPDGTNDSEEPLFFEQIRANGKRPNMERLKLLVAAHPKQIHFDLDQGIAVRCCGSGAGGNRLLVWLQVREILEKYQPRPGFCYGVRVNGKNVLSPSCLQKDGFDLDGERGVVYHHDSWGGRQYTMKLGLDPRAFAQDPDLLLLARINYWNEFSRSFVLSAIVILGIGFISTLVFHLLLKKMLASLTRLRATFREIASGKGDLTRKLHIEKLDEVGELSLDFNKFLGNIRSMVKVSMSTIHQLAASSEELSASAQSFSENSQEQVDRIQNIASSLDRINVVSVDVAKSANDQFLKYLSLTASMDDFSLNVQRMNKAVEETILLFLHISEKMGSSERSLDAMYQNMASIRESASQMAQIVQIINDISDRINLLSLNAAIEAARAGDSGRGFAVVADEISKLADQTATSTKEITKLIQISDREVQGGLHNVDGSVQVMKGLIFSVNEVSSKNKEISHLMKEQVELNDRITQFAEVEVSEGMDKVTNVIGTQKKLLDDITSELNGVLEINNVIASGSEELAAGSQELASAVEILNEHFGNFKIDKKE